MKSRTSTNLHLMHLLRCLFFIEALYDFGCSCAHIPGKWNDLADDLSRNCAYTFLSKRPGATAHTSRVPPQLLDLLLDVDIFFRSQSIKTYLAAVRNLHLMMGLLDPRDTTSLPRLKLALTGIEMVQAKSDEKPSKTCLPITPPILRKIRKLWDERPSRRDYVMPWAAMTLCFFRFLPVRGDYSPTAGCVQCTDSPILGRCGD